MSNVIFHIADISLDRRTREQLKLAARIDQERSDMALEKRWRERVRENEMRRFNAKVNDNVLPFILRKQAE